MNKIIAVFALGASSHLFAATSPFAASAQAIDAIVHDAKVQAELESQGAAIDAIVAATDGYVVQFKGIGGLAPLDCWINVHVQGAEGGGISLKVDEATCNK